MAPQDRIFRGNSANFGGLLPQDVLNPERSAIFIKLYIFRSATFRERDSERDADRLEKIWVEQKHLLEKFKPMLRPFATCLC